jgi:hypothetical protein
MAKPFSPSKAHNVPTDRINNVSAYVCFCLKAGGKSQEACFDFLFIFSVNHAQSRFCHDITEQHQFQ